MKNADKFKDVFGIYATELWAKSENEFLEWLNNEYDAAERKKGKWIELDTVKFYEDAVRRLEKSEITLGEFGRLIEPLR